jgi:hypothetical protein
MRSFCIGSNNRNKKAAKIQDRKYHVTRTTTWNPELSRYDLHSLLHAGNGMYYIDQKIQEL